MDNLTPRQRRKNMQRIRSKDTKPELILRKSLSSLGLRFRLHGKGIYGKPDIYIKKYKLAIFVDSDFWHGKLYREGKAVPKSNQEYWIPKLERNIQRDIEVNMELKNNGWTVMRFWESNIKKDVDQIADMIFEKISQLKSSK